MMLATNKEENKQGVYTMEISPIKEKSEYPYISVKIIADSIGINTVNTLEATPRLTTFEIECPRYIWAEVLTHKMFSRNAQSSRAVPTSKVIGVNEDFVRPIIWGKNRPGMRSKEELTGYPLMQVSGIWEAFAKDAFNTSKNLADLGLHKEYANRITEPFSKIKAVITATEFDNFFYLRIDPDAAQAEIVELATQMKHLYDKKEQAKMLPSGFWHTPYVRWENINGIQYFFDDEGNQLTTDEALMISASCCAQVSYRNLNTSKEKAIEIYHKLFTGPKPHMSPVEHQGKYVSIEDQCFSEAGWTHISKNAHLWSANFKGFIQYRQIIESR